MDKTTPQKLEPHKNYQLYDTNILIIATQVTQF